MSWNDGNSSVSAAALAGGAASVVTKSILFPADTIKCRLQFGRDWRTAVQLRGMYNGLVPKLLLYGPYQSVYMSVYTQSRDWLSSTGGSSLYVYALSGVFAELAGSVVRLPMEVIKQRMQSGRIKSNSELWSLIRSNPMMFYSRRNFCAQTLLHDIPGGMIHWMVYETTKRRSKEYGMDGVMAAVSGGIAGTFTAILVTPLDVVKTRIVTNAESGPKTHATIRGTVGAIWSENPRFFLRGWQARVAHIAPNSALYMFLFNKFYNGFVHT
jgi:solute carrier family 25 (mitochondrial S-adenosylmethionine transporter), member 26